MKNIVIAAGYATRLYPLTENFPKPLLKIGEATILGRLIDDIDRIDDINEHIIVTNHKFAHHFEKWAGQLNTSKPIRIIDDGTETNETRLGAVRDLLLALDVCQIEEEILVVAADNILDFSFRGFVEEFRKKGTSLIMCHYEPNLKALQRTGVIEVDANGKVLQMQEKPEVPVSHWAVPPFYLYTRHDLPLIKECLQHGCGSDAPGNLAHYLCDVITLHAWEMPGKRFDIGSLDSYREAQEMFGRTEEAMKIAAVVVTFNRLALLKKTIQCLKDTPLLDTIIIVNNGSTDGTGEWLAAQSGLTAIRQENVGGSGGFHTGMKYAYEAGFDWIWCMDDDVFPAPDCLEQLLRHDHPGAGILCPRRIQNGKIFVNECRKVNLSNPFTSLHQQKLSDEGINEPVSIMGMVFEGPLIKREVVEKVGYPNKDLFIFYDDTDYSYRTVLAGYEVMYIPDALLQKEQFFTHDTWEEKQKKKKWKRMYQIRNSAYFNHHYGKNFFVRYGRAFQGVFGYIVLALCCAPFTGAYRFRDIKRFWKAYTDGIRERLGKM